MTQNHSNQNGKTSRFSNQGVKAQAKHSEHSIGRSMIEMLAVLAVIGILSIVALVGFTYAMNKHRANETIYDVMLRGTNVPMIDEYYFDKETGYEFRFPGLVNNGRQGTYYPMTTQKDDGTSYYVEATGVTYRVCELILKMNPTDIDQIVVGNTVYTGDSDICGTEDGLAMKFCFGSDGTICDGTGQGGSSGGSGTGGGSGSGSGGPDDPDACQPGCSACERCVEGTCVLKTCSILSCPEGQESMGVDDCGCIIGCKSNCPDFTGCDGCREEIIDENGCRTCSEDQTIAKMTGSCCASESGTCCPLTDADCACVPDEACTCEDRGGTTVTIAGGSCCNEVVDCCQINAGDCPDSCEPTETDCPSDCGGASLLNPGKTCSDGSAGYWSVEIKGKPDGESGGCCLNCSGEPIPHAFWNGTAGKCCIGMPYQDRNGNWGCCNTEDGKWVSKIYGADSGEMCCPQGQNAYVWSETSSALCCNGEVARNSEGYYSCCSDGYHAFNIVGHPEGDDIGMCCHPDYTAAYWHESYGGQCCTGTPMTVETKRHDQEVYFCCKEGQKAYYDGSFKCCQGEIYDYDAQNYECCQYDENEQNVLSTIQFANFGSSSPISDKWCCPEGQTAYWTGSEGYGYNAQCCAGEPYMGIDAPECCYASYPSYDYDTGTEISIRQEVVSVAGIGGVSACCASEENGVPLGGAYFANSYSWMWGSRCCYGNIGAVPSGAASPADIDIYPTRTDEVYACCSPGTYVTAATGDKGDTHYGCCAQGVDYAAYGTPGGVTQYCCPEGTEAKVDNWGESFCCYPDETAVVWWEAGGYPRRCCPANAVICPVPDTNHLNCCATGCGENGGCNEDGGAGVGPRE